MNRSGTAIPARRRALLRPLTVAGAALAAVLALASPAAAHTEIEIDNPTAGATNVTMSVTAEAESKAAGIASVAVQLPAGLAPDQVSLASGPTGWTLTTTTDGYEVAGPALKIGVNAGYRITIRKLPETAGVLTFKTVVTYANGDTDSWIGAPDADNPAPTVTLTGGAGPTTAPSGTASAGATSNAPGPAFGTPGAAQPSGNGGWPVWATGLIILAGLAAAVGGVLLVRHRRATPPPAA